MVRYPAIPHPEFNLGFRSPSGRRLQLARNLQGCIQTRPGRLQEGGNVEVLKAAFEIEKPGRVQAELSAAHKRRCPAMPEMQFIQAEYFLRSFERDLRFQVPVSE